MFLLTSQFIKLLVHADNLNSTNYPLQIKDTDPFVICGFKSYILTLFVLFYTGVYINEMVIYASYNFSQARFLCLCLHFYFVYIFLYFFSYQLKDPPMPVLC